MGDTLSKNIVHTQKKEEIMENNIPKISPPLNEVSTPILPPDEVFIPILDIPAPLDIPEIQVLDILAPEGLPEIQIYPIYLEIRAKYEALFADLQIKEKVIADLQIKDAVKDGIIAELKNTIKEEEQTITFLHSRQEWIKGLTEKMTKMLDSSLGWREKISATKGITKEIAEANKMEENNER